MTLARVTLLAAATILSAQQMEEPVLRVTVRLVQIDAVVTNKHGKNVPDLTRDDFKLYQDGKEQAITHFSYIEAGGGTSSPAPSARRATAPGPQRISQTQMVGGVWTTHYCSYDAGFSVRQLSDTSGAVTRRMRGLAAHGRGTIRCRYRPFSAYWAYMLSHHS